jgi:hypothetical protein
MTTTSEGEKGLGEMLLRFGSADPLCGAMFPLICNTRAPDSANQPFICVSNAGSSLSSPLKILICCINPTVSGERMASVAPMIKMFYASLKTP